jgi:hypothetical protein
MKRILREEREENNRCAFRKNIEDHEENPMKSEKEIKRRDRRILNHDEKNTEGGTKEDKESERGEDKD